MHNLDSPRARYKSNVDTDKPCYECLMFNGSRGSPDCIMHDIEIASPGRSTCPSHVNGVPCDEHIGTEDRYRIKESCPWCNYSNEIESVANCQFEEWKRALEHLVGIHLLTEHPDKVARIVEVFTGSFQSFASLAVDAARKVGALADYGRKAGRVVGKLQKDAEKISK